MADEAPQSAGVCPRNRFKSSRDVDWDRQTIEIFNHQAIGYDVRTAKKYLADHRLPVEYVPVESLKDYMHGDAPGTHGPRAARLEPERLTRADPDIPLVFAQLPSGDRALIDGNHRLERARQSGCTEVPVVILPMHASAVASRDWTAPIVHRNVYPKR